MRNMFKTIALAATAVLIGAGAANAGAKLGVLTCDVEGGWGGIIGSQKEVHCTFTKTNGRTTEYVGSISRLGIDVGYLGNRKVVWAVVGVGKDKKADLSGTYIGASASATAIVGLGANALVGGMKNGIVLNPVSVEGSTGVAVAAGITSLTLE